MGSVSSAYANVGVLLLTMTAQCRRKWLRRTGVNAAVFGGVGLLATCRQRRGVKRRVNGSAVPCRLR